MSDAVSNVRTQARPFGGETEADPAPTALSPSLCSAFDLMQTPVWVVARGEGVPRFANRSALSLLGVSSVAAWEEAGFPCLPANRGPFTPAPQASKDAADQERSLAEGSGLSLAHQAVLQIGALSLECTVGPIALDTGQGWLVEAHPVSRETGGVVWSAEDVLAQSSVMISVYDSLGTVCYQNNAAHTVYGVETGGRRSFRGHFSDPHQAAEAMAALRDVGTYRGEVAVRTVHGMRWHLIEARKRVIAAGAPCNPPGECAVSSFTRGGFVVAESDITDQVRNQQTLNDTVERLAHSNSDLEQFAWVTSHDLREPLRSVVSYLNLLDRHLADRMDETGRDFMTYAINGARRMDVLTRDLLEYANIGRGHGVFHPVDLRTVVDRVVGGRALDLAACGASVTVQELPTVLGDDRDLTVLFTHLLDNAIRYRKTSEPLQVTVMAEREPQAWLIAVVDNGKGIHPRYFDRVFQIFQRLDCAGQTPGAQVGTGVGLALCRKVVERHGGRIWLESHEDRGAAFFFTLPFDRRRRADVSDEPDISRSSDPAARDADADQSLAEKGPIRV